MKKTLYVVWKMNDGALRSDTVEVEGKINHMSVEYAIKSQRLGYYDRSDFDRIISWQLEEEFTWEEREEFTWEEREEFWKN